MSLIPQEDVQRAREMDLLTFLQNYSPQELVRLSPNTYCTREHDSLKISNGMWHWFSHGIGGRSALDYLIRVQNQSFQQAVETILGRAAFVPPVSHQQTAKRETQLLLPKPNSDNRAVTQYLRGRGIHPEIIRYCLEHKLLYESKDYQNAVFLGYDLEGKARYANLRGTRSQYKSEATGSNKHFSFSIAANSSEVHVFEAAIDLLSHATLELINGHDWRRHHLLSLAGVYMTKRKDVVPVALERYLGDYPQIRTLHLHLDNDKIGQAALDASLEGMQRIVGGYIEQFCPFEECVAFICNEEGKIDGLPLNRAIREEDSIHEMSYGEMTELFRTAERNRKHLTGYVVFSQDSFSEPYPENARTCMVSSDNKAFQPNMGGNSIFASTIDGSDPMIRLESYMAVEKGGKDGWKVERCYMREPGKDIIDIIAGTCFICDCSGENFASLSAEQLNRYMTKYRYPEKFVRINGEIEVIPIKPNNKDFER